MKPERIPAPASDLSCVWLAGGRIFGGRGLFRFAYLFVLALSLCACNAPAPGNDIYTRAEKAYTAGWYLEAEKLYEQYLQNFPQGKHRWEVWNNLYEISSVVKGDNDKAMVLLEAMRLEYGGDNARFRQVMSKLARLQVQSGHWEKAADAWRQILRLQPQDNATTCSTILNLAQAYKMQGKYEALLHLLRENTHIHNPDEVDALPCEDALLYELAHTYTLVENWTEARNLLEKVIQSGTMSSEDLSVAKFLLSEVYLNLNSPVKALELLESIKKTHPNPIAVEAKIERLLKEYPDALPH